MSDYQPYATLLMRAEDDGTKAVLRALESLHVLRWHPAQECYEFEAREISREDLDHAINRQLGRRT